MKLMEKIKAQWYSVVMGALFILAWGFPSLPGMINVGGWAKTIAIMIIFFFTGLTLRTEDILPGITSWRLHVYIQGFCYIFMPIVCWVVMKTAGQGLHEALVIGFFLLSVLPITISSCVVFTQLAGGNFSGALFNAVIGNILGIFLSPALFVVMLGLTHISIKMNTLEILTSLGMMVLAPLFVGQMIHIYARNRTTKLQGIGSLVNRWCILLIIYFAFGQIFSEDSKMISFSGMILPLVLIIPGHIFFLWISGFGARLLGFNEKDRIAIFFCAPQKTLAMGLPLIAAVLSNRPELEGLATLPVILYHPIQLVIAGFLEQRIKGSKSH